MAVEDELVLPADGVAEGEEAAVVAGARDEHLFPVFGLAHVEGRRGKVHEQLRPCEREIGGGRAGLPDVLADRRADVDVTEAQEYEVVSLREVAMLVEDAVVGEKVLAVDASDCALRADSARVREVAVEPRCAHERHDARGLTCDRAQGLVGGVHESRPEEQILGWIAGHGELGEEGEVGAGPLCLAQRGHDLLAVALEVADNQVQLCERQSHGFRL